MINRNAESYFAKNPQIERPRSVFDLSHGEYTTFNLGSAIPHFLLECNPGDTIQLKTHAVVRANPMVVCPFDVIEMDTMYFYAPNRILWDNWTKFMGDVSNATYIEQTEYEVPQIKFDAVVDDTGHYGPAPGSVGDYLGLPMAGTLDRGGYTVSALPFRMYAFICNEFLRDQNLMNPVRVYLGDADESALSPLDSQYDYFNYVNVGQNALPFVACKLSDYFTRCLPKPQRLDEAVSVLPSSYVYFGDIREASDVFNEHSPNKNVLSQYVGPSNLANYGQPIFQNNTTPSSPNSTSLQPNNWMVENPTIPQLRLAFQLQKYYEQINRSGSRYREIMRSVYQVRLDDRTVQIPEYLGGSRTTLSANQVIATASTDDRKIASNAGYILDSNSNGDFIFSSSEHGWIMGITICRIHRTYQDGVDRFWSRKKKLDFFTPQFACIGDMPVYNKEIFVSGIPLTSDQDDVDNEVFGYQEMYADMRYRKNYVTGQMRSKVPNSLDMYHYADDYETLPRLGDSWIREDKSNLDRALEVTSAVTDQFQANYWFDLKVTRELPLHSIPGLVDHF